MQPFLQQGEIAGKISCPNPKCSAKVGNYDWTGVPCGCGEWVTPVSTQEHPRFTLIDELFSYTGILHTPVQSRRARVLDIYSPTPN